MIETNYQIATWFLVLSLFLPRLTLLIAYCNGVIPPNNIPFWGDFFMALFLPRVLILIYIATCMGFGVWFWVHVVAAVLTWGRTSTKVVEVKSKRS